jgi:hypothetical protein
MNFTESWTAAENTVFTALLSHFGHKEGREAWKGDELPEDRSGVWRISSGTSNSTQLVDVMRGGDPSFVELVLKATLQCRYSTRALAQEWAMTVLQRLADTDNANIQNTGNVTLFQIIDFPGEPQLIEFTEGTQAWHITIECELIFRTEDDL